VAIAKTGRRDKKYSRSPRYTRNDNPTNFRNTFFKPFLKINLRNSKVARIFATR